MLKVCVMDKVNGIRPQAIQGEDELEEFLDGKPIEYMKYTLPAGDSHKLKMYVSKDQDAEDRCHFIFDQKLNSFYGVAIIVKQDSKGNIVDLKSKDIETILSTIKIPYQPRLTEDRYGRARV